MYDPTLGRWLQQDPIGLDAGDPNLYRMEGNRPENEVDPTGTEGQVINSRNDLKSHVYFVVGQGLFGRTAPTGAGYYTDSEITDENIPYGYYSHIRANGDPDVNNCCNTPFQLNHTNFDAHGGAIALQLRGLSTGQYDVKVRVRVIAGVHKHNNPITPLFAVCKGDKDREQKGREEWRPELKLKRIKAGEDHYVASDEKELTIRGLNYESGFLSSSSDSILLRPSISFNGNRDEYIFVSTSIYVLEIKKVR